jgi:hypothetical protein
MVWALMAGVWSFKDKKRLTTFLIVLVLLSTSAANLFLNRHSSIKVSAVEAATSIGVYWDLNCTRSVDAIDWGTMVLGIEKIVTLYIRNEGNETCLLNGEIVNWQGDNTSNCMILRCERPKISPGKTVQINPVLLIFYNASGMTTFSFDMHIEALSTESAPGISDIDGLAIKAAENQAYFIYADPLRMTRAVATYDVASGSLVYGLCLNEQNQGFDTRADWVSQLPSDKGRPLLSNKTVLMFGSWHPHWCVDYLQARGLTPVSYSDSPVNGQTHYRFVVTNTSTVLVDAPQSINFEHEDYFVMMTLKDANNNTIFLFYGFDWKGTWSAGISLKSIYSNIATYSNQYYVIHWVDSNADGIPQPEEMTQIATG